MVTVIKKQYSWRSFDTDCRRIARWAKRHNFINIYGIPRGGLVVAVRLSHFTNMPVILDYKKISSKTLVVDDIYDTGKTISQLRKLIKAKPKVATIFLNPSFKSNAVSIKIKPDFTCRDKKYWIIFPWETKITSKYDSSFSK